MPSRVTFRHLALAQRSIQELAADIADLDSAAPPQIRLTDACLRICRAELTGRFEMRGNTLETRLYHVLKAAADARNPGKPRWAGYAEATLHFVERTLGMRFGRDDHSLSMDEPRERGQTCGTYSTPDFIADTMAREVLAEIRGLGRKADVLDLSVEAGQFPLSLIVQGGGDQVEFYGLDRDPTALEIAARIVGYAKLASSSLGFRLKVACLDSLLEDLPCRWPRQFSAVIGNPPWKARQQQYTQTVREYFRPTLRGNFDLYLAFFLRAHDLVCPAGLICFTIPSTFLFNQNAEGIRQLILDNYDILSLRLYPQRSFIEVPCVIPISILARRRTGKGSRAPTLISYHPVELGGPQRPRTAQRVQMAELWSQTPGHVFHPILRRGLGFLHEQLSSRTLKSFGQLACGARLSRIAGLRPECSFIGFRARDIRAFHACTRLARRYYPDDALFSRAPSTHANSVHKVVFQDLRYMTHAVRLVAAASAPGTLAVSTASMFIPENAASIEFYVALLNSSLANAWYKARDVNRAIKLCILGDLPVVFHERVWTRIAALARECARLRMTVHKATGMGPIAEDRILGSAPVRLPGWKDLVDQIDAEIFELYAVSQRERALVRQFVEARAF